MNKRLKAYIKKQQKRSYYVNLDMLMLYIKRYAILNEEYTRLKKAYDNGSDSDEDINRLFEVTEVLMDSRNAIIKMLEPIPILKIDNDEMPFDDIRVIPNRNIYIIWNGNRYQFGVDLPRDVYEKLVYCTNYELFN